MKNKILKKYPDLVWYRRKSIIVPFVFCAVYYIFIFAVFYWCYSVGHYENHPVFYAILIALVLIPLILFKPFAFLFKKDYKGIITDKKFINTNSSTMGVASISRRTNFQKEIVEHTINCENGQSINYEISNDNFDDSSEYMSTNWGTWKDASFKLTEKELNRCGMTFEQGYPLIVSPLRDYYNIGDEVEHFAGFYYNRKLSLKHDEKNICIVCGTLNLPKDDYCKNCGHSIVK